MSWAARFQLRQHFRQSLWAVPLLGAIAGAGLAVIDLGLEDRVTMPASWSYSPATASSVLTTVSGAMIGLLGLVVTVGVLVVQMATGTLSPRFMRLWYRDRLQKLVLAAFTATFAFSFVLLGTIEAGSVPHLAVTLAGFAVAVDLVLLLLYLDRFVHALRPVAVAAAVARSGQAVVADVDHAGIDLLAGDRSPPEVQGRKVRVRSRKSGAIQAMDARGMVDLATRHDLTCVLTCSVGDFVNAGSAVMDVYGSPDRRMLRRLRGKIALGHERTIDQDPAYAVRIIVDIAIRALSPAVNDPTTATQMINYLGAVLTDLGERELSGYGALLDAEGHLRLAFRMRTWDDYLHLGVSEIRQYGRESPQVCRRLRAMLADLEDTVLPVHRSAVRRELEVLDRTVRLVFADGAEQTFALGRDRQGIGGASQAAPVADVADGE
jgi:uncharacterized membrane protein